MSPSLDGCAAGPVSTSSYSGPGWKRLRTETAEVSNSVRDMLTVTCPSHVDTCPMRPHCHYICVVHRLSPFICRDRHRQMQGSQKSAVRRKEALLARTTSVASDRIGQLWQVDGAAIEAVNARRCQLLGWWIFASQMRHARCVVQQVGARRGVPFDMDFIRSHSIGRTPQSSTADCLLCENTQCVKEPSLMSCVQDVRKLPPRLHATMHTASAARLTAAAGVHALHGRAGASDVSRPSDVRGLLPKLHAAMQTASAKMLPCGGKSP